MIMPEKLSLSDFVSRRLHPVKVTIQLMTHELQQNSDGGQTKVNSDLFASAISTIELFVEDYEKLAKKFDPVKFDAAEWVRIAKDAGMKYMVITSKHHDGFSMFEIGLNYRRPVGFNLFNRKNTISIFAIYKNFINDLEFFNALKPKTIINELWTAGIVLEVDKPIKLLGLPFTSGGITYTYGDGFSGIGLTTGFPF